MAHFLFRFLYYRISLEDLFIYFYDKFYDKIGVRTCFCGKRINACGFRRNKNINFGTNSSKVRSENVLQHLSGCWCYRNLWIASNMVPGYLGLWIPDCTNTHLRLLLSAPEIKYQDGQKTKWPPNSFNSFLIRILYWDDAQDI